MSHNNIPVPSPGPSTATPSSTNTPDGTIFASAVRAQNGGIASDGVYDSDAIFNGDHKGVRLYINRTVATGTLTVSIQGRDPATGNWVVITGAITGVLNTAIETTLTVYPGITVAAGGVATSTEISNFLPNVWRVHAVVASNTTTWSIGAEYLL